MHAYRLAHNWWIRDHPYKTHNYHFIPKFGSKFNSSGRLVGEIYLVVRGQQGAQVGPLGRNSKGMFTRCTPNANTKRC